MQAACVKDCANVSSIPIIADGSIKEHGDIAKSLVLGATMVMIGGMLASHSDSPGAIVEQNGIQYKEVWGSASIHTKGKTNRVEGTKYLTKYKPYSLLEEYQRITESLQSAVSYGGGNNLACLARCKYVIR
jgi:GMP reductase